MKRTLIRRDRWVRAWALNLLGGVFLAHATLALGEPAPAPSSPDNRADNPLAPAAPDNTLAQPPDSGAREGAVPPALTSPPPTPPPSHPSVPSRSPVTTRLATSRGAVKPADAAAAAEQPMFGSFEGTYGLSGISTGFSFGPAGYYLGAELSVVRQFREFAWLGGYVDGVYDFGRDQTRLSIGPEVGWSALGIDGGYLLAVDDGGTRSGVTVRPMLTMGFVSAFGRFSHLFGPSASWFEAGLLVKYPLEF